MSPWLIYGVRELARDDFKGKGSGGFVTKHAAESAPPKTKSHMSHA